MAHLVLFHSIYGPRACERDLAARLSAKGHTVLTPDLYEGPTSDDIDEGFAIYRAIGQEVVMDRARAALSGMPPETVLSGISMGSGVAAALWAERPEAKAVVFISGPGPWPDPIPDVPVELHMALPDPFDDEAFVESWLAEAGPGRVAVHRYPGVGHYFLDPALDGYSAEAAAACEGRLAAVLERADAQM